MTRRKPDMADLVTGGEIGRRLGISRQRVQQLAARDDDFPAPLGKLGASLVWRWDDVEKWNRGRTDVRARTKTSDE